MVYTQNFELGVLLEIIVENITSKQQKITSKQRLNYVLTFKYWLLLRFNSFILWCLWLWERIKLMQNVLLGYKFSKLIEK